MKRLCLLLLLLLCFITNIYAQPGPVFHLNKLSKQDTILSGWKFEAGDDPKWAEANFDDSRWKPVDPAQDISAFTELHNSGIGWVRIHIMADSAIATQSLSVWIEQYTASEIYLNGRQILKYGTISPNPQKVVAYLPSTEPLSIDLRPGENLIAVRLAYQPGLPYVSNFYTPLPVFSLFLNDHNTALANYRTRQHAQTMSIITLGITGGMLAIISVIYFIYFLVDHSRKVNLYYALYGAMMSINALPNEIWGVERFGTVSSEMWMTFVVEIVLVPAMLFLLQTVYALFAYPHRWVFKLLVLVGVFAVIATYTNGTFGGWLCATVYPVICVIDGAIACIWAMKRKLKDAGIILLGIFLFTVLEVISSIIDQTNVLSQVLYYAAILTFPVGMSFYLGVQSSLTNKNLRVTLAEVQALSAQTLAQEAEKQQLLASQNEILEQQVSERTAELNRSLQELKATQTQLIQSEKMASLGELTAGIAHEIQNPLNFVNNFSDVNREMLSELQEELTKGDIAEAKAIAADIEQNEQKINHHGKRAEAIVKGMLEHSRSSTGQKELTDINQLADEYIRLSYHGLKAKDKSFNSELLTNFYATLPKVNAIPQDIGRVLLNLFNNAFYAVNQKAKTAGVDYKPEVSVTTSTENGQVIIKVKDNGIGIPDAIKEKIMQPFFTTKPTGEGTGLGLSLTYDMVVKGHGGNIIVESVEGEGSQFTVKLPVT